MPMNLTDFDGIKGKTSGKGGFKSDPNSLTSRVFNHVASAGQAVSAEDVAGAIEVKEGEDQKKVDQTLMALAYDQRKITAGDQKGEKATKLVRGFNDSDGIYYYALNPNWQ